jgi:hypothetical protein
MTEHVDFVDRRIYFHGLPFFTPTEYMHAITRWRRLLRLLIAKRYLRAFLRLGDLPALVGIDDMFANIPILSLPYPPMPVQQRSIGKQTTISHDLVFAGALTSYRKQVLKTIGQQFDILVLEKQVSRRQRDAMFSKAKAILNIPQDADWKWISSMRIMAGWRCGRAVVNVGLGMEGVLGRFVLNIPLGLDGNAAIRDLLKDPAGAFLQQKAAYDRHVLSEENGLFPEGFFRTWAITELGA